MSRNAAHIAIKTYEGVSAYGFSVRSEATGCRFRQNTTEIAKTRKKQKAVAKVSKEPVRIRIGGNSPFYPPRAGEGTEWFPGGRNLWDE